MSKSRIWQLKLNLDEFNALVSSFFSDEQRAFALQGFTLGMNAGDLPQNVPAAFASAFALGKAMRDEAQSFIDGRSEDGKRSAEVRKAKYGNAQPKKTTTEAPSEGGSEAPSEAPSEGGIEPNDKRQTTNEERKNQKPRAAPIPPEGADSVPLPVRFSQSPRFAEIWTTWIQDRKSRKKPMTKAAAEAQLRKLESAPTVQDAIDCIEKSIAGGWQGIFPPDDEWKKRNEEMKARQTNATRDWTLFV